MKMTPIFSDWNTKTRKEAPCESKKPLRSSLSYSSILKMKYRYCSETSVDFNGLQDIILHNTASGVFHADARIFPVK
jgi:hypothetical protein